MTLESAVRRGLREAGLRASSVGLVAASLAGVGSCWAAGPFPPAFELTSLFAANGGDGSEGFVLIGLEASRVGFAVDSAGDVNGDGIDDLVIGAPGDGFFCFGDQAFVVFGSDQQPGPEFELSRLLTVNGGDGSDGFVLVGSNCSSTGLSVSTAGDVNGDGFEDILIGEPFVFPFAPRNPGRTYVVFGTDQGFEAEIELASLRPENGGDGSIGFVLKGINDYDAVGATVNAAGDVNGDGLDDLILSALRADPSDAGESYVVFGNDQGFPAAFELSGLFADNGGDGSAGFVMRGIALPFSDGEQSGGSVSGAGDINGDGVDDVIVGARLADRGGRTDAGRVYVIFGSDQAFAPEIELSGLLPANGGNGSAGFALNGVDSNDNAGFTVAAAGDVNGDGVGDLLLSAPGADPGGRSEAGDSYVIFGGQAGFPAELELSDLLAANGGDGSAGFVLHGIDADGSPLPFVGSFLTIAAASELGAGDVNGDGLDDLLIGAPGAGQAGESYVVFGSVDAFPAEIMLSSLLPRAGGAGSRGFVLRGVDAGSLSGYSVSAAADVNGDGIDDVVIGAFQENFIGIGPEGGAYVVFGRSATLSASLAGVNASLVGCENLTTGQTVTMQLPEPGLETSWDCEGLGLTVSTGDNVVVLMRGHNLGSEFVGCVGRLESGASAICRNLTQEMSVNVPLTTQGNWDCAAAGLSLGDLDFVSATVTGVVK